MNNYPNFKNYNYTDLYNTMSNSFNNQYNEIINDISGFNFKNNNSTNTLYDPYSGFIRGNMFKNLYDPYKQGEPYEIKPMNDQAKLLTDIDSLSFAMIDLNLF